MLHNPVYTLIDKEEVKAFLYEEARKKATTDFTDEKVRKKYRGIWRVYISDDKIISGLINFIMNKTELVGEQMKSETPNKVDVMSINYENYLPYKVIDYKDVTGEEDRLTQVIKKGMNYILESEKGLGKTSLVYNVCYKTDTPIVAFSCSSGTTIGDLLGKEHLTSNGSIIELGVLTKAIMVANHYGKCVLYLDELNALEPEVQKILNPICDDRRRIEFNNTVYKLEDGVTFSVVATQNPQTYSGTNSLTKDLRSRFCGEILQFPEKETMKEIIDWENVPEMIVNGMLTIAYDVNLASVENKVSDIISTRDLSHFAQMYRLWSTDGSLKPNEILVKTLGTTIFIKFGDPTDRQFVMDKIQDTFAIKGTISINK